MRPRADVRQGLTLRAAPLRVRLVAGFALVMLAVLSAAGSFVYWRVQVDLDRTLDNTLSAQANELRQALQTNPQSPASALASLSGESRVASSQVVDPTGHVLARTGNAPATSLLRRQSSLSPTHPQTEYNVGELLGPAGRRLRVLAYRLPAVNRSQPVFIVTTVPLGQRDEALRELLAQLAVANLAALAIASAVGYRLARAALLPVERYRGQAEEITAGATGIRLDVPDGTDDEISRLGHTLNQMLSALEQAGTAQRQFLADASHELRTPLAILSGEVELALRRPRSNAELEGTLRDVAVDTHRLTHLANQLLDLEHANAPHVRTGAGARPAADLHAAVQRAVLRGQAVREDDRRALHVRATHGLRVVGTDTQLDQVLGNLVDNAVLHGAGNIGVDADRVTTAGGAAATRLTVHDEGVAVAASFVPYAIDRFRRADPARTGGGSGLGLSLVHSLARSLGGELRLCTSGQHHTYLPVQFPDVPCTHLAAGTTVTVVLPG